MTALTTFTTSGATIIQNATTKTTGALNYNGITAINLGGNITTSGGIISLTGPVTLNTNAVLDATNAGGTVAGANITLATSVDGAKTLTLTGGTSGTCSIRSHWWDDSFNHFHDNRSYDHSKCLSEDYWSFELYRNLSYKSGRQYHESGGTIGLTGPVR